MRISAHPKNLRRDRDEQERSASNKTAWGSEDDEKGQTDRRNTRDIAGLSWS
jgi:hypothetical protein